MRHLTRIVRAPLGVNILGLLELFAFVGILGGLSFISDELPRVVGILFLCTGFVAVIAFDLWWRSRQPEPTRQARMLSPFAGGCFVFIPIWLLLPLFCLVVAVCIAIKFA